MLNHPNCLPVLFSRIVFIQWFSCSFSFLTLKKLNWPNTLLKKTFLTKTQYCLKSQDASKFKNFKTVEENSKQQQQQLQTCDFKTLNIHSMDVCFVFGWLDTYVWRHIDMTNISCSFLGPSNGVTQHVNASQTCCWYCSPQLQKKKKRWTHLKVRMHSGL